MFGIFVIFSDSLKGYFSPFFGIRGQLICIWKGFFDTQHTEAAEEGCKVGPFKSKKPF
jgi:hypothetical protein